MVARRRGCDTDRRHHPAVTGPRGPARSMTIRVRPLALLFLLLAAAAASPLSVAASWAPPAEHSAALATTACPLAVNTEITNVSAIVPTRVDVLANDCAGAATASRPLRITAVHQGTYGSVTTDGATLTYDPRGCATGDAHGNAFVSYTISDAAASKTGIAAIHVLRPGRSPPGAPRPPPSAPPARR